MKRRVVIYLFLILITASLFRFYRINEHGLYENDEIMYFRDTLTAGNSILNYLNSSTQKTFSNFLRAMLPIANAFSAKPGHILLGLWGFFIWGNLQYGVLITTVVWGLFSIVVVSLIGYKFYGYKTAILSALLLSVSAIHVKFSRTYLAHIDQSFFIMLATLFYLFSKTKSRHRMLYLASSGLCLGFAFTVHPQAVIYFPLFFIYETFGYFTDKVNSSSKKISETIFLFLMCLAPILNFVLMSGFGNLASGLPPFSTGLHGCYLGQLFWNIGETRFYAEETSRNLDKLFLFKYFAFSQGRVFAILSVFASLIFLKNIIFKRRLVDLVVFSQSASLFFYWQFLSGKEQLLRFIVGTIPFFCLAISAVLEDKDYSKYLTKTIKIGLILILMVEGIALSARTIVTDNSPYLVMEKFFIANKAKRILSTSRAIVDLRDVLMPDLKNITLVNLEDPTLLKQEILKNKIEYFVLSPGSWLNNADYRFKTKPELIIPSLDYPGLYCQLAGKGQEVKKYWNNPLAKSIVVYKATDLLKEPESEF